MGSCFCFKVDFELVSLHFVSFYDKALKIYSKQLLSNAVQSPCIISKDVRLWLFVKKTTKRKYWLISFLCFFNRIIVHTEMSGCFEYVRLPNIEWLEVGDRRNVVASIIAGLLVSKLLFLRDYIYNHWARICYRDEVHLDTIRPSCKILEKI